MRVSCNNAGCVQGSDVQTLKGINKHPKQRQHCSQNCQTTLRVLCILALVLASAAALPGIQGKFIFPEAKADAYVEVRAILRGLAATENR